MFLAERPAPTGAFDFAALAVPAIGRVLRYAQVDTTADGRRIWQEIPDEYAIGFPRDLRNGNGGVAIGYNYNNNGNIIFGSCGGFMWSTGEDLRDAADPGLAARLSRTGLLHVNGLQGNGTWLLRRHDEPPLASYFIAYIDELDDPEARGHMGDIAIVRACTPAPPAGLMPPGGGLGPPPPGGLPPGGPPPGRNPPGHQPPGGCPPTQLRDARNGNCVPNCPRPDIQVNGKCCPVTAIAATAACSNSNCPSGQTPIGPSNFCCNGSQVYANAAGAQACCSGQVVNGQCQPSTPPPNCVVGSTNPQCCPSGYVSTGASCCLASQMTSTGTCCPSGQMPSGPNKGQCKPIIRIPPGHQCCASGLIPAGDGSCCAAANVTTTGMCCSQPVDPRDRTHCPAQIQIVPNCAAGYSRRRDARRVLRL